MSVPLSLRRSVAPAAWYAALSIGLLWPAALHPIAAVPGAPRTDLADALWTAWFVALRLGSGRLPDSVDGLLNFPHGGGLWPADPLNGLIGAPLVVTIGAAATWTVLAHLHLIFAGFTAHKLGEHFAANGLVAGTLYAAAPITLAHLHNGATEAVGGTGWLALAALTTVRLVDRPGWHRILACAAAAAAAAVAHAYTGALAAIFGGVVFAFAPGWRSRAHLLVAGGLAALLAAAPLAIALDRATAADNVVGIKTDKELATIRRTIGPADPEGFIHPGDFRSPDFHTLSRYGEEMVHCAYLGWVPLLAAAISLRRRRGVGVLWAAGALALLLSMGPVLVEAGGPVILAGRRAVPLPYLLVEGLPGFRSLSLLWRLAQLAVLCLAVLAARAPGRSVGLAWALVVATLAETRLVSPARALPWHMSGEIAPEITALAAEPDGAVMNFPVVGGRPYLYEQTAHGKPLTGSLNFPNNGASRRVWKAAMETAPGNVDRFRDEVVASARAEGVRYLIVHVDARAYDDDLHTEAVRAMKDAFTPIAASGSVRVYRFW
ncbi:MAG: hypothetical protein EXR71_06205 [Myxococcales bacterium]|nr:hypothetical protein [Myxococcales bacterium]